MKLENGFAVQAPPDHIWRLLLDIERVAACLPGATVEPGPSDGEYTGEIRVKLGPMTLTYRRTLRLSEVDSDEHKATIEVKARELKRQGTASARIDNQVHSPNGGPTLAHAETDQTVTGRPAQLGRGIVQEVAANPLDDFGRNLERQLRGPGGDGRTASEQADVQPPSTLDERGEALDVSSALYAPVARRAGIGLAVIVLIAVPLRVRRRSRSLKGGTE